MLPFLLLCLSSPTIPVIHGIFLQSPIASACSWNGQRLSARHHGPLPCRHKGQRTSKSWARRYWGREVTHSCSDGSGVGWELGELLRVPDRGPAGKVCRMVRPEKKAGGWRSLHMFSSFPFCLCLEQWYPTTFTVTVCQERALSSTEPKSWC